MKIPWMLALTLALISSAQCQKAEKSAAYLGFDRNDYPGDENLPTLHKIFSYSGYWLNAPPGESATSWTGKRNKLLRAGFGFLVLFNGRTDAQIKAGANAKDLGAADAQSAIASAQNEGFPRQTIIFLDQEEGGRLLPEQKDYLFAWVDTVNASGFRAGVYCSAIPFKEGSGDIVVTAEDIHADAAGRQIRYWVTNDACPPSPGCARSKPPLSPRESGVEFASVWQFAQSPKRASVPGKCGGYSPDGNCYASHTGEQHIFVDLNAATSPDPSAGRGFH